MAIYMFNPFAENENSKAEVVFLYNKNFQGIDMKYVFTIMETYRRTRSEELKNAMLTVLRDKDLLETIIHEYVDDVSSETGKINRYSTLSDGKAVASVRRGLETLVNNQGALNPIIQKLRRGV